MAWAVTIERETIPRWNSSGKQGITMSLVSDKMRAVNLSLAWVVTTERERLSRGGIVRENRNSSGYHYCPASQE